MYKISPRTDPCRTDDVSIVTLLVFDLYTLKESSGLIFTVSKGH